MERLFDDAANIQRILPWIDSQEEILYFLRNVPIDKHHLRIQLAFSYFFKLRDQSEQHFEQNINEDAREIVIILPDTPHKLIKSRLRELGNIPNRKEIVVKGFIKERPDLLRLVDELESNNGSLSQRGDVETNNLNEDTHEEPATRYYPAQETTVNYQTDNLDTTPVMKHQKDDVEPNNLSYGGKDRQNDLLEHNQLRKRQNAETLTLNNMNDNKETNIKIKIRKVEGSLEVVSSIKEEYVLSPMKKVRQRPVDQTLAPSSSTTIISNANYTPEVNVNPCCSKVSTMTTATPVTSVVNINNANEVPEVFNLIEYLKDVTHYPEATIKRKCEILGIRVNERPNEHVLNVLVNEIFDTAIELDDSESESDTMEGKLDKYVLNEIQPKDYRKKNKSILKPATLIIGENSPPLEITEIPRRNDIIHPARLTLPKRQVISAVPPAFIERITIRNNDGTRPENPILRKSTPTTGSFPNVPTMIFDPEAATPAEQPVPPPVQKYDEKLVLRLIEMFPEACPDYIRDICRGKLWAELDDVVTVILSEENYPKRPQRVPSPQKEVDINEQLEIVKALLPDADPTFLRWKCETIGNNTESLNDFINEARELKNYPTMKEYLRKQKLSAQSKQYTTEFNVENFIKLFPEPAKTFADPNRTVNIDNYTSLYICNFFQNRYDKLQLRTIRGVLSSSGYKICASDAKLQHALATGPIMKSKRKHVCLQDPPQNIAVLQEIAYLTHKDDIEMYLFETEEKEQQERQHAKENGLMKTCECCYDEEVMPKNCFNCPKGCNFCRDCIQKSCEVALGDGKTEFSCMNNCSEEFSLHTLQEVLPPKMFSKLAQKKALAEVKAAGIEELESCPFCDFASIPNANDKIFRCLNPDCMKESCRLCKEENHVPYRCDELEKDEDVKARVFVENQMTEALLCKCYKCGTSFFKEEGCNKMTCTCGAKMCYICKQPVTDYSHFNGIGGDKFHLCPLYSDTNEINQNNVIKAAEAAKSQVDPTKLKVDPTVDIQQHYADRKRQLPAEPHVQILNDFRNQRRALNHRMQYILEMMQQRQPVHHHHHHHHVNNPQ